MQYNAMPTVSAYAHLNGPFNYNKMLLAPIGVRFKSTRNQTAVERGHSTPLMDGTYPPCQSITAHMCAISSPPRAIDCQILSTSGTST
jgi:hypothetical protein